MDYAIGDIQGCYDNLMSLLDVINFDNQSDRLWLAGDLVNRGPNSLGVLRFLKQLDIPPVIVLGNHDLHMLAVFYQQRPYKKEKDTFEDVLNAPDAAELCHWLRQQPFIYYDEQLNYVMTHAGIVPTWNLDTALKIGLELQKKLQDAPLALFKIMYGNTPNQWSQAISHEQRWRFAINAFTRMRYCYHDGSLNFDCKNMSPPEGLLPWFSLPSRLSIEANILFGHWASLNGQTHTPNIFALDTGCVWGGKLTALCLQTQTHFQTEGHTEK